MARGSTVRHNILTGYALNAGVPNQIKADWPLDGSGWFMLMLEFVIDIVIGTGTGAKSFGELNLLKNIIFNTSEDGETHNASGHALFRFAHIAAEVEPYRDAIAATTGKYRVSLPLYFANPLLARQEDTILATGRYDGVDLNINLGSLSDLFTSVGTATMAVTLNVTAIRTEGTLAVEAAPAALPYFKGLPMLDPVVGQKIALERASDLRYLMLMFATMNSVTAGLPFSGTPTANVIKDVTISHSKKNIVRQMPIDNLRQDMRRQSSLETLPVGLFNHNFAEDGSIMSGLYADPRTISDWSLAWTNDTPSTSGVSAIVIGAKDLKPVPSEFSA